ncbi:squalene/phytoene synthase family protein [Oerskovia sp. M15]
MRRAVTSRPSTAWSGSPTRSSTRAAARGRRAAHRPGGGDGSRSRERVLDQPRRPLVRAHRAPHGIGHPEIDPFFASMRTDLTVQVHDKASYEQYVYGSAEVVGLMCLAVFLNAERRPGEAVVHATDTVVRGARGSGPPSRRSTSSATCAPTTRTWAGATSPGSPRPS